MGFVKYRDYEIKEALKLANGGGSTGAFGQAARFITSAMPQAISIDNFIEAHRENEAVELCGKLAIIRCILSAERGGPLYVDRKDVGRSIFPGISKTWLAQFFKTLTENVARSDLEAALANVGIICFNYDRCIEHYLVSALANYYGMQLAEAQGYVEGMQILHPYGTVGGMPWRGNGSLQVPFGSDVGHAEHLLELVEGIKTFSERFEDSASLSRIRELVEQSETVVFLGFAFHRQNMTLLKSAPTNARRVFATAYGFSDTDCVEVANELKEFFPRAAQWEVNAQVRSHDFFHQYKRTLSLN